MKYLVYLCSLAVAFLSGKQLGLKLSSANDTVSGSLVASPVKENPRGVASEDYRFSSKEELEDYLIKSIVNNGIRREEFKVAVVFKQH